MEWVGLGGCLMLGIASIIRAIRCLNSNRRSEVRYAVATAVYLALFSWFLVDYYSSESLLTAIANAITVEIGIALLVVVHILLLAHSVAHPPFANKAGWSELKRGFCRQALVVAEASLIFFYGYLGILFRDASLLVASSSGSYVQVQRSLALGADPACDSVGGIMAVPVNGCLESALDQGNVRIARLLIAHGSPLDEPDPITHVTPLMYEVGRSDKAAVVFLIDQGANISATTGNGLTALKCAAHNADIARLLLKHGAFVNTTTPNGSNALFDFARAGNALGIKYLIDRGAYVPAVTRTGYTPLMAAARGGNPAVVVELISAGARMNLKDKLGHDALWYATSSHHMQAARLLEQKMRRLSPTIVFSGSLVAL